MKHVNASFTLPVSLYNDLKSIAKREGRSVSAQVRIFLANSVTRKNTELAQGGAK